MDAAYWRAWLKTHGGAKPFSLTGNVTLLKDGRLPVLKKGKEISEITGDLLLNDEAPCRISKATADRIKHNWSDKYETQSVISFYIAADKVKLFSTEVFPEGYVEEKPEVTEPEPPAPPAPPPPAPAPPPKKETIWDKLKRWAVKVQLKTFIIGFGSGIIFSMLFIFLIGSRAKVG